ncbi:MAG: tetratricopeptide repeat protein, partial [Planctomycetaceae bacterium]|nr:tetratricopeptide repeat protein [Planctomycetaceae bacterium]
LAMLDLPRARAYLATWQERRTATPDQVQGLLWQAMALLLAHEVEQATVCYRRAVELDPANREARLALTQVLAHSDPAEAMEHLQVLRQANPADADVLYQQAIVERNLGRLEEAASTLDRLFAVAPDHLEGIVLRGRVALDQRQTEEAGRWFRRAERLAPDRHAVLTAMIDFLRLTGRGDEAQRYQERLQKAVQRITTMLQQGPSSAASGADQQPVAPRPAPR